jgi:short chain dehydrogenase
VCNAATLELNRLDGPITELSLDAWNAILTADLTSVFLSAKHGVRAMLQGGGGSVVLVSSTAALRGMNGLDAYSASSCPSTAVLFRFRTCRARLRQTCRTIDERDRELPSSDCLKALLGAHSGVEGPIDDACCDVSQTEAVVPGVDTELVERIVDPNVVALSEDSFGLFDADTAGEHRV